MEIPPYETLATLARDVDSFAVIEHLQALGSPTEVSAAYTQLLLDAYWKHKDLPMVVTLATAGIHFNFTHAKLAPSDAARMEFKSAAKNLAYNLASFTWPGWDEPGIIINHTERIRGLDAARLNLRLALELQKPFGKICAAAWLLGAHFLADGDMEEAMFHFKYAIPEKDHADYSLFQGYVLLAECLLEQEGAAARWAAHLEGLKTQGTEATQFAHDQLATAYRVFHKMGHKSQLPS